jgi:MFS family permease
MEQTMTIPNAAAPATTAKAGPAPRAGARLALASLSLAMLLPSLDTSIANSSLPTLADAFGAGFAAVQWVVLAYLMAVTAVIVGAGRLGDRLGRRRLLLAGIAQFTVASLLCGAAPTIGALIAARAAQGLGAAVMLAMTMALAGEVAPRARTGAAIGLLGTMSASGTALGPSLGGVLAAWAGWRAIFLVSVPLGVVAFGLAARYLPADGPRTANGRGGLGWADARLLREPGLAAGLAMTMMVSTVIMATLVVGPFHLARALGLGTAQVGFVMSVGPLVAALTGVPAGRLTDRLGAARVTRVGLVSMLLGCVALAVLPVSLGVAGYVGSVAFITAGYAMFQTGNNTGIMSGADAGRRGVTAGLLSLARNLGLMAGVAGMGAVFAAGVGSGDVGTAGGAAVAQGTRVVFLVGAGIALMGMALARVRRTGDPA